MVIYIITIDEVKILQVILKNDTKNWLHCLESDKSNFFFFFYPDAYGYFIKLG